MAGYGYKSGYTPYGSTEPPRYGLRKQSYDDDNNKYSDQVRRPVIVDAEGKRRQQVVSFAPPGTYITKTETIVEQVETRPVMTEYRFGVPRVESPMGYGGIDGGRHLSSSVQGYRSLQPKVEEFVTKIQTEVSPPNRTSPSNYWRQGSDLTRQHETTGYGHNDYNDNGRNEWTLPSGYNRSDYKDSDRKEWTQVSGYGQGDYKDNDHKEWTRPSGYDQSDYKDNDRNKWSRPSDYDHSDYKDNDCIEWTRPNGDSHRDGHFNGYNNTREPIMHTRGAGGSPTIPSQVGRLSSATNDIGTAIEYLKQASEGVKPPMNVATASKPRFRVGVPRETYG